MMKSGIYTITCLVNNKIYVGQSINIKQRLTKHRYKLLNNKHPNTYLQSSVNKYSIENFLFEELILCSEDLLYSEEHYWTILLNTYDRKYGYNIDNTNPNTKRTQRSEETKEKLRIANLGKTLSEESRLKVSLASTGRRMSEELKLKMSLDRKGISTTGDKRIPVSQYSLNNEFIRNWGSAKEASLSLPKCASSEISSLCRIYAGTSNRNKKIKLKSVGGFIWKYRQK